MKKRILVLLVVLPLISGLRIGQENMKYNPPAWSIESEDTTLKTISRKFLMNNPQSWLVNAKPIKGESEVKWVGDVSIPKYGEINEKNIEFASWKFIKDHRNLLQIDPDQLEIQYSEFIGGEWVVSFAQHYKDIPVYGGRIDLNILPNGDVAMLSNYFKRRVNQIETDPQVTQDKAIEKALASLTLTSKAQKIYRNNLIIYPLLKEQKYHYRLSWWFEIVTNAPKGQWEFIVDAHTGEILEKKDRSVLQTTMK